MQDTISQNTQQEIEDLTNKIKNNGFDGLTLEDLQKCKGYFDSIGTDKTADILTPDQYKSFLSALRKTESAQQKISRNVIMSISDNQNPGDESGDEIAKEGTLNIGNGLTVEKYQKYLANNENNPEQQQYDSQSSCNLSEPSPQNMFGKQETLNSNPQEELDTERTVKEIITSKLNLGYVPKQEIKCTDIRNALQQNINAHNNTKSTETYPLNTSYFPSNSMNRLNIREYNKKTQISLNNMVDECKKDNSLGARFVNWLGSWLCPDTSRQFNGDVYQCGDNDEVDESKNTQNNTQRRDVQNVVVNNFKF